MDVSYADPAVAAFVVIPVLLLIAFVWGTMTAWRRRGAAAQTASQAGLIVGAAAFVWLAALAGHLIFFRALRIQDVRYDGRL